MKKSILPRAIYRFSAIPIKLPEVFVTVHFSLVLQSCPTLRPHESQHAKPPCPTPTPRVHSCSCPSSHLILRHPLLLLPPIPPSIIIFSNKSVLHIRWPNYWSFSFSISPSSEYTGMISFRMDWFDLFVVQGTLKSLIQHHSSKASILRHSTFFMV